MKYISVLVQHHPGPTGNVLICKNKNGKWEFPCAKLCGTETSPDAAVRVAAEKLGMAVKAGKLIMIGHKNIHAGYTEHIACGNITHNTNSKEIYHEYYEAVNTWQTEPQKLVYDEFKWVHPSELGQYEFEGDDINFMAKYDPWVNAKFIPDQRMY